MFKVLPFMKEGAWQWYRVVDTDKPLQRDECTNEMQYREMCQAKEKIDAEIICRLLNEDREKATLFRSREQADKVLMLMGKNYECKRQKDGRYLCYKDGYANEWA